MLSAGTDGVFQAGLSWVIAFSSVMDRVTVYQLVCMVFQAGLSRVIAFSSVMDHVISWYLRCVSSWTKLGHSFLLCYESCMLSAMFRAGIGLNTSNLVRKKLIKVLLGGLKCIL